MIEKLQAKTIEKDGGAFGIIIERRFATEEEMQEKINELVDAVNELQKKFGEIKIKTDITEECLHPTAKVDPYAEQRKWIGCLVRYKICDWQGGWYTDVLDEIVDHPIYPFKMRNGQTAQVCEVIEPSEIYPNKARTWQNQRW